jgi:hypothetical protein
MAVKIGAFIKTLKWYEWMILAEATAFVVLLMTVTVKGSMPIAGAVICALLYIGLSLFFWGYPAHLARKCRAKDRNSASIAIVTLTLLFYGLIGILVYAFIWLKSNASKTSGSSSSFRGAYSGYASSYMSKKCGSCGKPAPNSAKVGDVCGYCGVRWGYENTTRINH